VNTSHLLTKHLPAYLSTSSNLNPTNLPIRILNPTSEDGKYVRTEYAYARKFVKDMWDEYAEKVDAVIHTGMAGPWDLYSVEGEGF
jgi:pyroglutamyl-peptidase